MMIHVSFLPIALMLVVVAAMPIVAVGAEREDAKGEHLSPEVAAALKEEMSTAAATKAKRAFTVLVVDQDNHPVAGVPIRCSARSTKLSILDALTLGFLPDGDTYDRDEWIQSSDEQGFVRTKAVKFDHRFGMEFDRDAMPQNIAPVDGHHLLTLSAAEAKNLVPKQHPLAPNGVDAIFRVTRRPMPEVLAEIRSGLKILTDGEAYAWSVMGWSPGGGTLESVATVADKLPKYDFIVHVVRDPEYPLLKVDEKFNSTGPGEYGSYWSYRLQVTSGGLQLRDENGTFTAPEDGYGTTIERRFIPETPEYKRRDEVIFWWRMDRQPAVYGMVGLKIGPSQFGNYAEVNFTGRVNLKGSRVIVVKEAYQEAPPNWIKDLSREAGQLFRDQRTPIRDDLDLQRWDFKP